MAHYPPEELRAFVRGQRRSFASSKALAKERDEKERARIETALLALDREAAERRVRCSPSARATPKASSGTSTVTSDVGEQKPSTPATSARKHGSLGSLPASLNAPIPQSPLSEITNTGLASSVCAVGPGESLKTPDRSVPREDSVESRHAKENDPAPRKEEEPAKVELQLSPKRIDPRREWELEPLKRALEQFAQSDEVFQRPSRSTIQLSTSVSTKGVIPLVSTKQIAPTIHAATNKHSILPLLQTLAEKNERENADDGTGEPADAPEPVNVGVATGQEKAVTQTQTETAPVADESNMQRVAKSISSEASSDDEESHSSSNESEETASDDERAAIEDGSHDVSVPSSDSTRNDARASAGTEDRAAKEEGRSQFVQKDKGCAWVLDINGTEDDEPSPRAADAHEESTGSSEDDSYGEATFFSESQA